MTRRIDHTAIAVHDLTEAIGRYESLLQAEGTERLSLPEHGVEVAFLSLGDTQLELICPMDDESGVARFLTSRGEGLHHLGVAVEDLEVELQTLAERGIELIDTQPRPGAHGRVAFVHPRGTGGILLELVEHEVR